LQNQVFFLKAASTGVSSELANGELYVWILRIQVALVFDLVNKAFLSLCKWMLDHTAPFI